MYSIHDIQARVMMIASDISGTPLEEIRPDSTFVELDIDSLARIEILVELERVLGIESEEDGDLQSIKSIADAAKMVATLMANQSAS